MEGVRLLDVGTWRRMVSLGRQARRVAPRRVGTAYWAVLESTDSEEPLGQRGVAFGNAQHPVEVGAGDPEQRRPSSLHLGKSHVGTYGQLPCDADWLRCGPKKPPRQLSISAGQGVPQCHGLQRSYRHAQRICGVQAAECVAEHEQPGSGSGADARTGGEG